MAAALYLIELYRLKQNINVKINIQLNEIPRIQNKINVKASATKFCHEQQFKVKV